MSRLITSALALALALTASRSEKDSKSEGGLTRTDTVSPRRLTDTRDRAQPGRARLTAMSTDRPRTAATAPASAAPSTTVAV